MNKAIINDEIVIAYDVLKKSEIVENGKIKKTWRGQISTFGAAVTMGSLIPGRCAECGHCVKAGHEFIHPGKGVGGS